MDLGITTITDQHIFASENGYLAFVAGMVLGMVVFWRVFRVQKVQHSN
jgi:hypothetical protein